MTTLAKLRYLRFLFSYGETHGQSELFLKGVLSLMIFNQINEVRRDLFNELISDLNERFTDYPFAIEIIDVAPSSRWAGFYIALSPDGVYSLCWEFDRTNYNGLYFGISGKGKDEEHDALIVTTMSEIFPHMQGKPSQQYSWWSWDLDPQGKNRTPQNWGNDGVVWAKLGDRDEDTIFAALRDVILTVHEKWGSSTVCNLVATGNKIKKPSN
ncbi:hypothetical protein ACXV6R_004382, partial [Yersinia enterocolitica]